MSPTLGNTYLILSSYYSLRYIFPGYITTALTLNFGLDFSQICWGSGLNLISELNYSSTTSVLSYHKYPRFNSLWNTKSICLWAVCPIYWGVHLVYSLGKATNNSGGFYPLGWLGFQQMDYLLQWLLSIHWHYRCPQGSLNPPFAKGLFLKHCGYGQSCYPLCSLWLDGLPKSLRK